ncbi:Mitochondrial dicarboxylate carrier [Fasciola hepatica]|uniref:Mitochondrial dicarboxylate carrier n=1 Tax=Fasciola hepatica TaxID=6192 RepID=A0A4E0RKB4_FASHE|nr:Mitochondrial dicarboxylate carrier [Fasciola hepatica]
MANKGNALVSPPPKRSPRWYFGGLASAMAAGVTHPLDLVKVIMQTPGAKNPTFVRVAIRVIQSDGLLGLYNGISASLLRQVTYSLPRFGIYEVYKNSFDKSRKITFYEQSTHLCAGVGAAGAAVLLTQPFDVMKTRMQNAPPGHYTGLLSVAKDLMTTKATTPTAQPVQISRSLWHRVFAFTAFFKGITPAFVRIGPHTILLFVFKEQLTIFFGFTKSL